MEVNDTIRGLVTQILGKYTKSINETGHSASRQLETTAKYLCQFNGQYFEVYFILEDYWKYLEEGRRPGGKFPPIDAIEEWIRVKPVIPSANRGRVPTTKQLAYLISRSIAINGIEPTKLLKRSIDSSETLIDSIADELARQLEEELNNEVDENTV